MTRHPEKISDSGDFFAVVLHPTAQEFLEAPLSAKDQWKYDRWCERFERRYGKAPNVHLGAIGSLYGVAIEEDRDITGTGV